MGWRKTTFLDIQTLLLSVFPEYTVDMYNNQFDDWEGGENNETPLNFPVLLIEFIGGDWEHDGYQRICPAYFFRLHIGLEDLRESYTNSENQDAALDHLDEIERIANVFDFSTLTYVRELKFIREEIDSSRTMLIEHILDFQGYVVDCSLEEQRAYDQVQITQTEQSVDIDNSYSIP